MTISRNGRVGPDFTRAAMREVVRYFGDGPLLIEGRSITRPESVDGRKAANHAGFDELRAEFVRLLTQDSETRDRCRRDYNDAIFNAEQGWAVWSSTDLDMVMDKFDKAVRSIGGEHR